jgi:hypothetical protein
MPFQGLKRYAADVFKGGRDKLMDAVGIDYPEQLFIKSMTGGAAGDGTIRELPPEVLRDVRTQFDQQLMTREGLENEIALGEKKPQPTLEDAIHLQNLKKVLERGEFEPEGPITETRSRPVSMYGSSRDAHLGLGTVQVHRNPDGTVRITDVWDVDNPEDRLADGSIMDLAEGGRKATQVFDIANSLGTYQPMPIDIQLTADQWAAAQRSKSSQAERDKTMDTYVYENKNNPLPEQFGPFPSPPVMSDEEMEKKMESFIAAMNSGAFKP